MQDFSSTEKVNRLCREKKLYGYKANPSAPFEPWLIPAESFALYLRYGPYSTEQSYLEMDRVNIERNGGDMDLFVKTVDLFMATTHSTEFYTVEELAQIFDLPIAAACQMFLRRTFFNAILPVSCKRKKQVALSRVMKFLSASKHYRNGLELRHQALLEVNDSLEPKVRHILMLYMYYNQHGYLI